MGTLKEFLEEQDKTKEPRLAAVMAKREDWVRSVDLLIDCMKSWIDEADEHHILRTERVVYHLREEGLGFYDAHGLDITLEPWTIHARPIARRAVGPLDRPGDYRASRVFGRVDLTNGLKKFAIYRKADRVDSDWFMTNEDGYDRRAFDREAFEAVVQRLFA